jgi:hypothetical protein
VLSKATGERVWNGTTYVPTERPTAEEIAKQTFHTAALVDETDDGSWVVKCEGIKKSP